jgi:ATP-dependent RNA helicase DeaD
LDEADRMLDMGFIDDVDYILKFTPCGRQTLLFSATMPDEIRHVVHRYMHEPVYVELHKETPTVTTVDQEAWIALDRDKIECLKHVIDKEKPSACIIFVEMKRSADRLERILSRFYNVAAIHGDLSQAQRERVLNDFKSKKITYLIATDVAARGLDIPQVSHVFNFDLPKDVETFIHRVGRTGRAGAHGRAVNIATPEEANELSVIEHYAKVHMIKHTFKGALPSEKAFEMTEQMKSRQAIIPKWTKRTGGPGFGGRGRGGPRRGGRPGQGGFHGRGHGRGRR